MILILSLLFGLSRALHGGGYVGRSLSVCIMGVAYAAYLLATGHGLVDAGISSLIVTIGFYVGLLLGWGAYFSSFSGNIESTKEREFAPADWFAGLFQPKVETAADAGVGVLLECAEDLYYSGQPLSPYMPTLEMRISYGRDVYSWVFQDLFTGHFATIIGLLKSTAREQRNF